MKLFAIAGFSFTGSYVVVVKLALERVGIMFEVQGRTGKR
jgi:hypothetical protein